MKTSGVFPTKNGLVVTLKKNGGEQEEIRIEVDREKNTININSTQLALEVEKMSDLKKIKISF